VTKVVEGSLSIYDVRLDDGCVIKVSGMDVDPAEPGFAGPSIASVQAAATYSNALDVFVVNVVSIYLYSYYSYLKTF
jgi:hypothetical protein